MESGDALRDRQRLVGRAPTYREVSEIVEAMRAHALPLMQTLDSAVLDGTLFAVGTFADRSRARFDQNGVVKAISAIEIEAAAERIGGTDSTWDIIRYPDRYHYSLMEHHAILPAVRIASAGTDYYYLDAVSGELLNKVDVRRRAYRWWHNGLHRLDFTPSSRTQTFRNILMLPLLVGVALVATTGAFMGIRRVMPKRRP